jgi:hypothetical protein
VSTNLDAALAAHARQLLEEALVAAGGNRAAAAVALGVEERRLYRLLGGGAPSVATSLLVEVRTLGAERLRELAEAHGWPGVEARAARARAARG